MMKSSINYIQGSIYCVISFICLNSFWGLFGRNPQAGPLLADIIFNYFSDLGNYKHLFSIIDL